jgi:hypothetical protein
LVNPFPDAPSDLDHLLPAYAAQHEQYARRYRGIPRDKLIAYPVPGRWSMLELLCHVVDADLVMSDRIKRTIAMDRPLLCEYDESSYVRTLGYNERDADAEIALFEHNRRHMLPILRRLDESAWQRVGVHSRRGEFTLFVLVQYAVGHANHHYAFLAEKCRALGLDRSTDYAD